VSRGHQGHGGESEKTGHCDIKIEYFVSGGAIDAVCHESESEHNASRERTFRLVSAVARRQTISDGVSPRAESCVVRNESNQTLVKEKCIDKEPAVNSKG
jgi:hypothetical protein